MDPTTILVIVLVGLVVLGFLYFNIIFPIKAEKQEAKKKEAEKNETENKEVKAEVIAEKNPVSESEEAADEKAEAMVKNMPAKSRNHKKRKK